MTSRLLAALLALALLGAPAAAEVPEGAEYTHHRLTSADGTHLQADLLRPQGVERAPVLLLVTPYNPHGPNVEAAPGGAYGEVAPLDPIRRGFAVAIVSIRGFGGSGGCWDYFGPGEQQDVAAALEWAASSDWSTGRVGVVGGSYGGGTGIVALASGVPGLEAVATYAPVVSPYRTLYAGGVPYWINPSATVAYNSEYGLYPGAANDDPGYHTNWALRRTCTPNTPNADADPSSEYWRAREFEERAARSKVPVFGQLGFLDFNVSPENLGAFYRRVDGRGIWLTQTAHEFPAEKAFHAQVARFLEGALKGESAPQQRATVQEAPSLRWREERTWPPPDATPFEFALRPGSYVDQRGNGSGDNPWTSGTGPLPGESLPRKGEGNWTFTPPLADEVHLAGMGRVTARLDGPAEAWAVALLYDVSPDGSALLIVRGAHTLGDGNVSIRLQPQDWRVAKGHRLGLLLTGADDAWYVPVAGTGATVAVERAAIQLPVLRQRRERFLPGEPGERFGQVKRPIQIAAGTIAGATVPAHPPARVRDAMAPPARRLGVRARAWRVRGGVRLRVRVTLGGRPVRRARVRVRGAVAATGRHGTVHLTIRRRLSRVRVWVRASTRTAVLTVRVRPYRKPRLRKYVTRLTSTTNITPTTR